MKKLISMFSIVMLGFGLLSTQVFAGEEVGSTAAFNDESYTLEEMLQYALEDERMAQAEYEAIMETFQISRPFSNIVQAEITHEAAVINLYEARNMEVPVFEAKDYVVLPDSIEEIYEVGIQAEINNIEMYERFLKQELDDDVHLVFEALKKGSENHLSAFERNEGSINTGSGNARSGNARGNKAGNTPSKRGGNQGLGTCLNQ